MLKRSQRVFAPEHGAYTDCKHPPLILAPAKINLTLHVTGFHKTGYHLLDSLVAFADVGDFVSVFPAQGKNEEKNASFLDITGSYANQLPHNSENIILRALRYLDQDHNLVVSLVKNLPVAAGLGGGSSDAATALKIATAVLGCDLPSQEKLMEIGADVPACIEAHTLHMSGRGENIAPFTVTLPKMGVVLVNPNIRISTKAIFSRIKQYENPAMILPVKRFLDAADFALWAGMQRNDLEKAAISYAPIIQNVLDALRNTQDCLLARMSGSGASCFGLYKDKKTAKKATKQLTQKMPQWWIKSSQFIRATI